MADHRVAGGMEVLAEVAHALPRAGEAVADEHADLVFAHQSAEPAHRRLLAEIGARPLLQLGMRLGEGSGAAAALPRVRLSLSLLADMATFESARVDQVC